MNAEKQNDAGLQRAFNATWKVIGCFLKQINKQTNK